MRVEVWSPQDTLRHAHQEYGREEQLCLLIVRIVKRNVSTRHIPSWARRVARPAKRNSARRAMPRWAGRVAKPPVRSTDENSMKRLARKAARPAKRNSARRATLRWARRAARPAKRSWPRKKKGKSAQADARVLARALPCLLEEPPAAARKGVRHHGKNQPAWLCSDGCRKAAADRQQGWQGCP